MRILISQDVTCKKKKKNNNNEQYSLKKWRGMGGEAEKASHHKRLKQEGAEKSHLLIVIGV